MKMKKALAGSLIVTSLAGGIVAPAVASKFDAATPVVYAQEQEQVQFHIVIVDDTGNIIMELGSVMIAPGGTHVVDTPPSIEGWEFQYSVLEFGTIVQAGDVITYEMAKSESALFYVYKPSTTTSESTTTEAPTTEAPTTEVPTTEAPVTESQKATISFDLAGGSLNGQTGTVTLEAKVGDVITLPEAPTREGYQFLYWKGSVYQPGASYTVTGPKTFTAVWEPVAAPASTSTSTPAPTTSEAEKKILPVTGEAGSLLPFLGLALLSAGAYYKGRKK